MSQSSFQFVALPSARFASLFAMSEPALTALGARRMTADAKPGFPCRVSLVDAEIGEPVLLLPFVHHDVSSPYRASGPIFVRRDAVTATPAAGEVPALLRHRLLSIRAFDRNAMMIGAEVVEGAAVEEAIGRAFADARAAYLDVHNARPGCFNCRVVRA